MKTTRFGILLICLSLLLATSALAASGGRWQGSGGWGPQGSYGRLYDPATVESLRGSVLEVLRMTPMKGMGAGIHLKLRTETGVISIHLGPAWYIERLDTRIEKGDQLEVKGSRVTLDGKPAIIAAEVKKGDQVLLLRDDSGIPAWSGWRRGR
ncbi:DNA-binding protein [Geomonas sp.]|uniref:DNA-binding protein n=1 Tax=Geomonas sp. TaxID=2651584 RepID=UPI002B479E8D|nr:DNA-binding protein [Geomonas sp.]HJV35089.1 DNA-binding protein [Geomonas sp.]